MNLSAPIMVHWELTNACNLKCLHCYQQDDDVSIGHHLSKENIFEIAHKIIDSGVFQVTLTGGEIMALPFWDEIVALFNKNSIIPNLTSNGTLLNRKNIEKILRLDMNIQFSLDSHLPEVHNHIRQHPRAFELVIEGVKFLHKNNIPVVLSYCGNKQNINDIEGVIMLAADLGVSTLLVGEVLPLYGGCSVENHLSFSKNEYKKFIESFLHLQKKYKETVDVRISSEWGFLYSNEITHSPCSAMDRDMAILYDGYVYPCPFIRHANYRMGNLVQDNLKKVWAGAESDMFRNDKHIGCSNECDHFSKCKSGCKARLANNGLPINQRSTDCHIYRDEPEPTTFYNLPVIPKKQRTIL